MLVILGIESLASQKNSLTIALTLLSHMLLFKINGMKLDSPGETVSAFKSAVVSFPNLCSLRMPMVRGNRSSTCEDRIIREPTRQQKMSTNVQ